MTETANRWRMRCVDCGRFMGASSDGRAIGHMYYEPLSEYGPEVIEWTCRACCKKQGIEIGEAQ